MEPVIGESTEAPVAAPMMARANAPVAYSAPEVSGYSLYRYYDYFNEPEPDTVSVYITDGVENYGTVYESAYEIGGFDAFTSGSSWQSYTIDANSFKNNDWIFKGWSYKLTQNNDNHDLGNITDNAVGRRYTFGDGRNSVDAWCHQYNGGETISIHALWRTGLLGSHIEEKSTLHHSIYANFNPLVTVDVGENGKVTYNGTVVDKDTTDKKVEVEYGTAPDFTITPDTGYKVASVTFGDTTIQANEDGTYTPPSVTEPTTLKVEFEEIEENINVEALGLGVKFECADDDRHNSENIMLKVADKNTYYTISPVTDVSATVTIKADKYLEDYNKTNAGHSLVNPNGEYTIQLTLVDSTKWIVEGDEIVTIPVTCKAETEKITEVEVVLGDGIKEKLPYPYYWYSSVHAEYGTGDEYITLINNNNGGFHSHADKKDIPDDLTTEVNSVEKAKNFFTGFTFVEMNIFEENPWFPLNYIVDVSFENTKMIITLDTPANPDPEEPTINELDKILGNVIVHCITDGSGHEDKVFSFKDVDSDNVDGLYYEVNWTKENPTHATVTINHDPYVERYNLYTFPKSHKKAQDILETTFNLEWEDGEWKKADETASPITIAVTCSLPMPVLDNVYVQLKCLNNAGHDGNKIALKDLAIGSYYSCKIDENAKTATVSVNEQVNTWVTNSNTIGNPVHVWAENELNTVTLQYNNGWSLVDANNDTITIQTICAPTIDEINAKLDVSVDCNNANANPEHKAMIFEDLLADSYEIGTPELSGSEYICDVTVKAEKYVTEYDKEYRPEHSNADNQTVTFKFKDGKWTLESDPTSVNFIVTCDFPNGPSEDEIAELGLKLQLNCATTPNPHGIAKYDVTDKNTFEVSDVIYTDAADAPSHYYVNVTVDGSSYLTQYNNDKGVHSWVGSNEAVFKVYARELEIARKTEYIWNIVDSETMTLQVQHTNPTDPTDPGTNPGGNGGDNDDDDDDDRYTGGNTVTRTINDDDVPLNDRPTNTTTIDDEDVPLADLPDDTVTIDDGEVPLKANPSTGDSLPFAAMAAAALSLGGVIVLNRKKK